MKNLINKIVAGFNSTDTVAFSEIDPFKDVNSWVSTGSPAFDLWLGTYGFPTGTIELRGDSRTGKTTMSLQAIKNALESSPNAVCVVMSVERRDNKPYAQRMGIDTTQVIVHKIRNIEQAFLKMQETLHVTNEVFKAEKIKGKPKFIFVLDSLGAVLSKADEKKFQKNLKEEMKEVGEESEGGSSEHSPATVAKAFKQGVRWVTSKIYDNDIIFFVINHTYDKIGFMAQGKESYGGKGIHYMPTIRLETSFKFSGGDVKSGDEVIGQLIDVKVIKSDFGRNKNKFEIEIAFGLGIVLSKADIELAEKNGLLVKKGANGYEGFKGKLSWANKKQFYELYKNKNPYIKILTKQLTKIAHDKVKAIRDKENKEASQSDDVE